jgi:hypothetical protein
MVKTFDVIKGGAPGLCLCLKRLAINAFSFETVKETFHSGIIVSLRQFGSCLLACLVVARVLDSSRSCRYSHDQSDGATQLLDGDE